MTKLKRRLPRAASSLRVVRIQSRNSFRKSSSPEITSPRSASSIEAKRGSPLQGQALRSRGPQASRWPQ